MATLYSRRWVLTVVCTDQLPSATSLTAHLDDHSVVEAVRWYPDTQILLRHLQITHDGVWADIDGRCLDGRHDSQ